MVQKVRSDMMDKIDWLKVGKYKWKKLLHNKQISTFPIRVRIRYLRMNDGKVGTSRSVIIRKTMAVGDCPRNRQLRPDLHKLCTAPRRFYARYTA